MPQINAYKTHLKYSAGNDCFPLFQEYNSGNDTSQLCSDCNLETWQAVLNSPFGYEEDLAASYSSLTSSYVPFQVCAAQVSTYFTAVSSKKSLTDPSHHVKVPNKFLSGHVAHAVCHRNNHRDHPLHEHHYRSDPNLYL